MIIVAKNISKIYKNADNQKYVAIDNISLEIEEGDFISIVGASGSGKSTLMYLLSGMENLTSGNVELFGKNISVLKDKEKAKLRQTKIGFVFQFYNLIMEMNVYDNIVLPALIGKRKLDNKRIQDILDYCYLSGKDKKYPAQLSGGEQQRVAIARALYNEPKILFADEPTGNLDSENGKRIMDLFTKMNKEKNVTIIQVTHSQEHAEYAKKIIRLKDGKII